MTQHSIQRDPTPPNMTQRAFKRNSDIAGNGSHVCQHGDHPVTTSHHPTSTQYKRPRSDPLFRSLHGGHCCWTSFPVTLTASLFSQSSIIHGVGGINAFARGKAGCTDPTCSALFSRTTLPARRDAVIADRLIKGQTSVAIADTGGLVVRKLRLGLRIVAVLLRCTVFGPIV